ncbi:MAG: hypothetical protein JJU41_12510 [Bacteroidetes bacterium]|nr:hypothetical protein [Bacteroidota bacterium]
MIYTRLNKLVIAVLIVVGLTAAEIYAQQKGNPFVRHFTPEDYQSQTQVFDITQAPDNTLLFATGQGVIQFDGTRFRAIGGQRKMVTHLHVATGDSIVYGGNSYLGTLVPSSSAGYSYLNHSSNWENQAIGGVFNLVEFNEATYIPVRESLLRFSGGAFDTIPSTVTRFFRAFTLYDSLYVATQLDGLFKLHNDSLITAAGGEQFTGRMIPYFMLPYDDEKVVFGTSRAGLFWYYPQQTSEHAAGTILPFPNEVNDLLAEAVTIEGIELKSWLYAIGTGSEGVFIINRNGELVQRINRDSGISPDFVNALFEDRQGNLWIGQNNGLILAEVASPLTFYGELNGLTGLTVAMLQSGEQIYIGTTTGLHTLENSIITPSESVRAVTWDLDLHHDAQGIPTGKIFASNQFGLYLKDSPNTQTLFEGGTSSVLQSRRNPDILYLGTQIAIMRFERQNGEFRNTHNIPLEDPVRYLVEDKDDGLWIATQADGFRYLPDSFDADAMRIYTHGSDGRLLSNALIRDIYGTLYASNNEWFYRYDSDADEFQRYTPPGLTEEDLRGAFHFVYHDGTMWFGSSFQRSRITEITDFFGDSPQINTHDFAAIAPGAITLRVERAMGDIWFGTTADLYRYTPGKSQLYAEFNDVMIRELEVVMDDTTRSYYPVESEPLRLPFDNSRLRFSFASPWFDSNQFMEYRYRLTGLDTQWSTWSMQPFVEYTSLREGRYSLEVQARNREGIVSDPVQWSFQVTPPWFRTIWAYIFYASGLLLLTYVGSRQVARNRVQKLEKFNRELEKMVDERSEEIRLQNEKLRQMNQEKSDFMNIAAHDLRNPLTAVQGIASIMADPNDTFTKEEILDFADIISTSSDRMFELIENYLNVHKLEQGEVIAQVQSMRLQEAIKKSIERFEQQAAKKKMTINVLGADQEIVVSADPSLTEQVLDNLISNAIKYSPIGSEITVHLSGDGKAGYVTVTDNGPGIPQEKMADLYKKFAKIGNVPTGGEVSTGLGLSIVKHLLTMMKGEIRCESQPGKGTSFTISLPGF